MKIRSWVVVALAAIAMLAIGGVALAEQGSGERTKGGDDDRSLRSKVQEARKHVMRSHREVFLDGKVMVVKTDRGELLGATENTIEIKYEDSSTARIETVGQMHVCVGGNRDAKLTDLQAGDRITVMRATNTPKGDRTVVARDDGEGKGHPCGRGKGDQKPPSEGGQ